MLMGISLQGYRGFRLVGHPGRPARWSVYLADRYEGIGPSFLNSLAYCTVSAFSAAADGAHVSALAPNSPASGRCDGQRRGLAAELDDAWQSPRSGAKAIEGPGRAVGARPGASWSLPVNLAP